MNAGQPEVDAAKPAAAMICQCVSAVSRLRVRPPAGDDVSVELRFASTIFAVCWLSASPVWGQPPTRSFVELKDRLRVGDAITITDNGGHETAGRLSDVSATSLRLRVGRTTKSFSIEDVQRVQGRRPDSLVNGLLIGAAAGAGYGLFWYLKDPNECGNSVCGSDMALGMAVGAAVGLGIDAAIKKNMVLYVAPASRASVRAGIAIRW